MKLKSIAALALCAAVAGGIACGALPAIKAEAAGTPIDVWLIGGQSNAVGYAQDSPSDSDPRYTQGFDNVLYYGAYETDTNSCPTDFVPVKLGQGKNWSGGTKGSGAEIGIASALGDSQGKNAIIKCAWGATFLYPDRSASVSQSQGTWTSPSYQQSSGQTGGMIGNLYRRFLQTVQTGLGKLKAQGYLPTVRGMWWMQGEAESGTSAYANAYEACLTDFISDIRGDLSDVAESDLSEMPFVLGKIYRNPAYPAQAHIDTVRRAQQQVADTLAGVFAVDCTGLAQQDGWHFKADAQKYLGEQFVSAVLASEGLRKVTVNAENVSVSGAGIKEAGQTVRLRVTPKRGYRVTGVSYRQAGGEEISLSQTDGVYNFVMPDANVTVTVKTQALPLYRVTEITVNSADMGSVFPSAEAKNGWYEGESVQIAVQPKSGCRIARVTVNGQETACDSERNGLYLYTVSCLADVVFRAEFTKADAPPAAEEPPVPTQPTEEEKADKNYTGLIAGCSVGGAALLGGGAAAAVIVLKKKKK